MSFEVDACMTFASGPPASSPAGPQASRLRSGAAAGRRRASRRDGSVPFIILALLLLTTSAFAQQSSITINDDLASWWRTGRMGLQYLLFKSGPLAVAAGHAAAFVRTRPESKRPDAQLYFINFSSAERGGKLHAHSGFTTSVSQCQVESRGSVHLRSADPAAPPSIRYNYLATENDRRVMVDGLKLLRRIADTPPMRDYVLDEYLPGPKVQSDADWLAFCRESGSTVFHPSSTCRMGTVVDERLRVKGVSGLRVIDASVMPSVPSGNINAAVLAVAEKGADLVRAR